MPLNVGGEVGRPLSPQLPNMVTSRLDFRSESSQVPAAGVTLVGDFRWRLLLAHSAPVWPINGRVRLDLF